MKYLENNIEIKPNVTHTLDLKVSANDWKTRQGIFQADIKARYAAQGHIFTFERIVPIVFDENGNLIGETIYWDTANGVRCYFHLNPVPVIVGAVIAIILKCALALGAVIVIVGIALYVAGVAAGKGAEAAAYGFWTIAPVVGLGLIAWFFFIRKGK